MLQKKKGVCKKSKLPIFIGIFIITLILVSANKLIPKTKAEGQNSR